MADIDALIESVDDERARAAACMDVNEERRSKMATPIQAHARGMLARRNTTREESSLVQKARRASAGLVDFTRSLYLELTELTDPAPPPAVAASPAVPPAAASALTGDAQVLSDSSPTPQQLRTLPLESPSAPATPLARATRPRPRDEASCCSCLTRNGGGAPLFVGAPPRA